MKYIDVEKLIAALERQNVDKKTIEPVIRIIDSLQQEHSEIDLKRFTEKIKTFQGRYKHPESIAIKGAIAFMARMFYQYPNSARQWYDSLPKATMDDARKEE